MPTIKYLPEGVEAPCAEGETVFSVARRVGVQIETSCTGKATCGLCRVKVIEGEQLLSPYNDEEEKHLGNVYYLTKIRLSCQAAIQGDGEVIVELAPKKRRKRG